jgi:biotin-dependent carboxylase-like uncharacterized protein
MAVRRPECRRGERSLSGIETIRPGLFTTVQDRGRTGYSRWGVPPSGAADPASARAANWLAGNDESAALLEVTLGSAEFSVGAACRMGIAGATAAVTVNGGEVARTATLVLRAGDRVAIGPAREGLRVYVAVGGGIDVAPVLGSRATLSACAMGGFRGRRLAAGDVLPSGEAAAVETRALSGDGDPLVLRDEARVVGGPQFDLFPASAREAFFGGRFRVSPRSDRRGLRLEGAAVAPIRGDIDPEGVLVGAIQVPAGGEPIVLMPDGPVTGGYPKIATVIRADLPVLGQWRPGQAVGFREVTREDAIAAWKEREDAWRKHIEAARST